MTRMMFVTLCSVCLLLVESATSLRCKTGIQQADDQYRKMVQICKKRYMGDDNYSDDSSSSKDEDSDNSSSMDMFKTKFFMSSGSKSTSNTQSWKDQSDNRNHGNNQRNGNDQHHSINYTNGRNGQYPNHGSNNHNFSYFDGTARTNYNQMYNSNPDSYNKEREQGCIIQCFFNELNVVDQRGFPEQHSIIELMTHNMHNPELQDFVEEAVIECFHYLIPDMRQDKCRFSQNLLTCLADKGKERCEDWDD